jgi:predicted ATPase/DNA-binding SARP family transcriptional activator
MMHEPGRSPSSSPPPEWRIQLLGELRITFAGRDVPRSFTRKIGGLLGYLACFLERAHPRDALIELFWPEVDRESGRTSLRSALPLLHRLLEPLPHTPEASSDSALIADRQTVRLDPERVTTDVVEFECDLQAAAQAAPAEQAALLERAVLLYSGELLPGYSEPWVLAERARLAAAYGRGLRGLAAARARQGDPAGAIEAARRAVQVDPLEEAGQYELIRQYAAAGRIAAARRQYQELERLLKAELGVAPSQSLSTFLDQGERSRVSSLPAPETPPAPDRRPPSIPPPFSPLPVPLTPFFGREAEIAQVRAMLKGGDTRLVSLTGLGGTGKTRLAIEVARRLQEEGSDWTGVAFVPLVDLTDPRLILRTLCGALNLPTTGATDPLEQIATALGDQRFLMVLDNFEQLLDGDTRGTDGDLGPATVEQLLERAARLVCLVTSRRPLGLTAEADYLVPPLPTPVAAAPPEQLLEFASVRLFLNRAQAARPDFQVTAANAEAVTQLCQALEGIPLALELAAARSPVLTPAQMLQHLSDRFSFLVARHRDVAERHRTLRAALEWSYHVLPAEHQRLLARLSVFRGGWTLEAAEAVCGDETSTSCLDALLELRNAALVIAEEAGEAMRFRMLETVREYGAERLAELGEAEVVRERHWEWYLELAGQARREWDDSERAAWLDQLDTEHDNLRAALTWCFTVQSGAERGLRLAGALRPFWEVRGHVSEGRGFLEQALARVGDPTPERAEALNGAGMLAWMQGDFDAAQARFEASLAIQRDLGDRQGAAGSVHRLGQVAFAQGDYEAARARYTESLSLREESDRHGIAWSTHELARAAGALGDFEAASTWHEKSLQLFRELGMTRALAYSLVGRGDILFQQGDYAAAGAHYEEALKVFRDQGSRSNVAIALNKLGNVARVRGDRRTARALHAESLAIRQEMGDKVGIAWSLEAFARLAAPIAPERAARLRGAAESLREALHAPLPPHEQGEYDRHRTALREALGEEAFARAWAAGRAMTPEEATGEALEMDHA